MRLNIVFVVDHLPPLIYGRNNLWVIDIFDDRRRNVGWTHFTFKNNGNEILIEELFVLPSHQKKGLGNKMLTYVENVANSYCISRIVGNISKFDLVNGRKDYIDGFFKKKGYILKKDTGAFRGSYYSFEKVMNENIYFYKT